MSRPPPLLQIKALRRHALGPLSLDIREGECVCISGPSGCGKSQLLRAVADMDPHTGEVWLAGESRESLPANDWRTRVGLLPPESAWWLPLAGDHFSEPAAVPFEALGFGEDILRMPVTRLSSGERQRLSLLRLLANRPRVLLLDEPTANLDPDNTARVEGLVRDYLEQHHAAALWISHDREQVARVADRHFILSDGALLENARAAA